MRKMVISSLVVATFATGVQAGGDILPVSMENETVEVLTEPIVVPPVAEPVVIPPKVEVKAIPKVTKVEEKHESAFYVVGKGLYISGEENNNIDGDSGKGFGLDLGYRINKNLAVELDGSYSKNEEKGTGYDMSYKTAALSLVYTLHATDAVGIFAKAGYMNEKSAMHGDTESESGLAYGGGLEYALSHNTALVAEYETSNIDSTRGNAISLGLMYNF